MWHTYDKDEEAHYVMHEWQKSRPLWHSHMAIIKSIMSYSYRKYHYHYDLQIKYLEDESLIYDDWLLTFILLNILCKLGFGALWNEQELEFLFSLQFSKVIMISERVWESSNLWVFS